MAIFTIHIATAQVNYHNTTVDSSLHSSAIGYSSSATGLASFAVGWNANAEGHRAFAVGKYSTASEENSIAIGMGAYAIRPYSIALGNNVISGMNSSPFTGSNAICIGNQSIANGDYSMAFGQNVKAGSTNSIVIGEGYSEDQKLNNSTPNSLAIGFNSTQATLFVSGATGGATETGNVGIGTSFPMSGKLHVYRDATTGGFGSVNTANSVLRIEDKYNNLYVDGNALYCTGTGDLSLGTLGPEAVVIGTDNTKRMKIFTNDEVHFYGNRKIEVNSRVGIVDINASSGGWAMGLNFIGYDGTSHGGWKAYGSRDELNYYYVGDSYSAPLMAIIPNGNVGIGTTTPSEKLEVGGDALFDGDIRIGNGYGAKITFHPGDGNKAIFHQGVWNSKYLFQGTDGNGVHDLMEISSNWGAPEVSVNGKLYAEEIEVIANVTMPDYVFESDYNLKTLEEVEGYIAKHKHLPGVPSAKEIEQDGLNLGDMDAVLLEKIEELVLYNIQQNKQIQEQQEMISILKQEIENLKN